MYLVAENNHLSIQSVISATIRELWEISFGPQADKQWMAFNGPYFNDPVQSWSTFQVSYETHSVENPHRGVIYYHDRIVGEVFAHWEDGNLKQWLELGILIYDVQDWGKGFGQTALKLWIPYLFDLHPHIHRVGYTTWSGNLGMMAAGEKIGMTQEARVRKVRLVNEHYYDSIKYGILREEQLQF